ncbi:MAG: hypothetical protein EXS31_04030 [Pedosphaera sp.]|nr:hypothetical protein [Pedosphaera sp.]
MSKKGYIGPVVSIRPLFKIKLDEYTQQWGPLLQAELDAPAHAFREWLPPPEPVIEPPKMMEAHGTFSAFMQSRAMNDFSATPFAIADARIEARCQSSRLAF